MDNNSNEFKKLQKLWYDKLAKSGFEDAEKDDQHLKEFSVRPHLTNLRFINESYYRLAGQFFHEYKFKDMNEKIIWKYHSEGTPYDKLPARVKTVLRRGRRYYYNVVKRLSNEMLKLYGVQK